MKLFHKLWAYAHLVVVGFYIEILTLKEIAVFWSNGPFYGPYLVLGRMGFISEFATWLRQNFDKILLGKKNSENYQLH